MPVSSNTAKMAYSRSPSVQRSKCLNSDELSMRGSFRLIIGTGMSDMMLAQIPSPSAQPQKIRSLCQIVLRDAGDSSAFSMNIRCNSSFVSGSSSGYISSILVSAHSYVSIVDLDRSLDRRLSRNILIAWSVLISHP